VTDEKAMPERTQTARPEDTTRPQSDLAAYFGAVKTIVWKDLVMERRTRQTLSIMAVFSLAAVTVFNFALELELDAARNVSTGLLWIVILLAGTLGLNRSLATEQENRSMEAVLVAPVDRSAIYAGKVISVSLFVLLLEAILVPVFVAFFDKPYWRPQVLFILVLGTIGYVAAGVLVASMSIQTRSRDVLLPVLLLPLSLPSVLAAATAVSAYVLPELPPWSEVQTPVALVVAFDVLMLTAGFLTYHYVVEE
jgi:heme exporter protein B